MRKEEVIQRLCKLVTEVGSDVFGSTVEHDCFCGDHPVDRLEGGIMPPDPVISKDVLTFIEGATRRSIKELKGIIRP